MMDLRSADTLALQIWAWTGRTNRIFLHTSSFLFHCTRSWLGKGCRGEVFLKFICIYYVVLVLWQWQLDIWLVIGDLCPIWGMPCRSEVPSLPARALCLVWCSAGPLTVCMLSAHSMGQRKDWKKVGNS